MDEMGDRERKLVEFMAQVSRSGVIAGHPDTLALLGLDRPEWKGIRSVPMPMAEPGMLYTGDAFRDTNGTPA